MSAQHTPGPWSFEVNAGNANEQLSIKGPNGETVVAGCGCCGSPFGDNLKHDAPLLSAATELLAALDILRDCLENSIELLGHDPADDARVKLARAAIAKATGERQ